MGFAGARLLKLGFQGYKQTEEMVAGGTAGKSWCMTLEKSMELQSGGRLVSVILSSPWVRVTGMRHSDNRGASNPGLPKMRESGWDKSDGS